MVNAVEIFQVMKIRYLVFIYVYVTYFNFLICVFYKYNIHLLDDIEFFILD